MLVLYSLYACISFQLDTMTELLETHSDSNGQIDGTDKVLISFKHADL